MTGTPLYEGKAKILYATDDPAVLLVHFKDSATAFNAQKKGEIPNKGRVNCAIASKIFQYLAQQGIPTHFIRQVGSNQMLVKALQIIPLEVVVRNIAAGSLCQRLGIALGTKLPAPLVEFFYKNDSLGDPLVTHAHIQLLGIATPDQLEQLSQLALRINRHLQAFFACAKLILVDFKLEFGLDQGGNILLADEISPDSCRLWDEREGELRDRIMDKDRFRQDLGRIAEAYQEVANRIQAVDQKMIPVGDTNLGNFASYLPSY
jgi:phosphoribosylaminoimidazole-succinocarboxamide synthase